MQRKLVLFVGAILILSALALPVGGQGSDPCTTNKVTNPRPSGWYSLGKPATYYSDDCFHQYMTNAPDTAIVDVLIVPPAGPLPLRDISLLRQSVDMWDQGIDRMARATGRAWLADGLVINSFVVGLDSALDGYAAAVADPEIIIVTTDVIAAGYAGIGTDTVDFCHGLPNPFPSSGQIAAMPGFNGHHGNGWGTLNAACGNGGGGRVCVVVNNAWLFVPSDGVADAYYDLNSHEFGHCLGVGHVGDASDFAAKAYPRDDIMSYAQDTWSPPYALCVSNLDVKTLAYRYWPFIPGAPAERDSQADVLGGYMTMTGGRDPWANPGPTSWRIVKADGTLSASAADCPQPNPNLLGAELPNPLAGEPEPEPETVASLTITSPADGHSVEAADGLTVTGIAEFIEDAGPLPKVSEHIAGNLFAYNMPGSIGISNVAAIVTGAAGDGVPKYPGGSDVDFSARSVVDGQSRIGEATPNNAYLFREDGSVAVGPVEGTGSNEADSVPPGTGYAYGPPGAITLPTEAGRYYLAIALEVNGQQHFIRDTSAGHPSGLKPIDVVGVPAAPTSAGPAQPTAPGGLSALTRVTSTANIPLDMLATSFDDDEGDGLLPLTSMDAVAVRLVDTTATDLVFELEVADMGDLPKSVDLLGLGGASFKHGLEFCTSGGGAVGEYPATFGTAATECYSIEFTQGALGDTVAFSVVAQDGSGCGTPAPEPVTAAVTGNVVAFTVPRGALTAASHPANLDGCLANGVDMGGSPLADGEKLTYLVGQTTASAGLGVTYNPIVDDVGGIVDPPHVFASVTALTADAGGPYAGAIDAAIGLVASATGGSGAYTFAWDLDDDGAFDDATGAATSFTRATAGAFPVAVQVTSGADTATDAAIVTVGDVEPPASERVTVTLGGVSASTPVDASAGPDAWTIPLDLSTLATGDYDLVATWFDADDNVLASAQVAGIHIDAVTCEGGGSGDTHGGSSGLCSENVLPEILGSTFAFGGLDVVEQGAGSNARSFQVVVRDRNGHDRLDLDALTVDFEPGTGVALRETDPVVDVVAPDDPATAWDDSLTNLVLTVHFVVDDSAPVGDFDIRLTVVDTEALSSSQSFVDVFSVIPAGDYIVDIVGADVLDFGDVQTMAQNVVSRNYFTVTNLLHESNLFEFTMEDFQNVDSNVDCTADGLTPSQSLDCIELAGNLKVLVDPSPTAGEFTFTGEDVREYLFDGSVMSIGEIEDQAQVGVRLIILDVGVLHEGTFGTTFSIPEPTPVVP